MFDSFTDVALFHWTTASRQYVSSQLNVDSVGTFRKFGYAIRFLDEALQLITTEKISDFSLYDKIRTKINNFEFVPWFFAFSWFFRLVREKDFFVYFEKLWRELAAMYAPMDTTIDDLKEGVELRDRIMYPSNKLKFDDSSSLR